MKNGFTKLMAALALLVLVALPAVGWGQTRTEVIDVMNQTWTDITGTSYSSFSGKAGSASDAVYAGNCAGDKYSIQLRSNNNNSGIVSTTSGGTVTKVTVTWQSDTQNGRTLNVYGSNSAYSTPSDLYGNNAGTLIGTIVKGTSTELTITDSYAYIGMRSASGAMYLTEIDVTWSTGGSSGPTTYTVTYDANGGTGTMVDGNSPYEAGVEVTLLTNTFTAPEGKIWDSWEVKDAGDNDITVSNGKFTMPANNVTVKAQWVADPNATQYEWVLTDLADLTSDDIFVIVGTISGTSYSMSNDKGTEAGPTASSVTIENERITSIVGANLKWNVSGNATNGYTFYPNGDSEKWLYCNTTAQSGSNNNMRVGTGNRKVFSLNTTNSYLVTKDSNTARYVCVYADGHDWRGYVSGSTAITFYKRQEVNNDPYITANNVELTYNQTEGTITYQLHNATGNITATTSADWITSLTPNASTSTVAIVCTANNSNESREATVVLAYGEATKEVTVSQAANPNAALTTMDEIFARATEVGNTATDVTITLNNWVVSGANDSSHAFVTDGTKGFMIYATSSKSNHGFNAGDILSGTVQCKVQLYNGSAEITNLTSASEGLTVTTGGNVAVADIAMANLQGINTGALVSYENLTCSTQQSSNYTNYYLTDGTTTIQAYHTLMGDLTNYFENGKTYNITGVFVQNTSTKRIMPRSAADIEEVAITEPNTITAGTLTHVSINELWDGDMNDITLGDAVEEGTTVFFSLTVDENYTLESVSVLDANNTTVQVTENVGNWSFTMPNSSVTINATATQGSVPPSLTGTITFGSGEGSTNINDTSVTGEDSMGNTWTITTVFDGVDPSFTPNSGYAQVGSSKKPASSITFTTTLSEAKTIASFEAKFGGFSGTAGNINLYVGEENVGTGSLNATEDVIVESTETATGTELTVTVTDIAKGVKCYYISYTFEEEVTAEYQLDITGYTDDNTKTGYYLIASPVTVDPEDVGMTTGDFDLYEYDDTQEKEWLNWKGDQDLGYEGHFNLVPGKGYLYAKKATTENPTYSFTLTGTPYTGEGEIEIAAGWNLVGNPFGVEAEISSNYYALNQTSEELIATSADNNVAAMQGVFVYSENASTVIMLPANTGTNTGNDKLSLNVGRNGSLVDRAIVRFGEGQQLPKFQLNPNNTKVYIPQGNQDFAIVRSAAEAEMPVSFKASENGTYTLAVDAENVEMNYLHLIDNMTGMDVDLLATPSYSFEAKTTDYASRFKLVFKAGTGIDENTTTASFAFFNGDSWTVSNQGEAALQVIDMMGRVLSSETLNGNATINVNETAGIYMLRLVNGNSVKVQKVVVK